LARHTQLLALIKSEPKTIHARSADGRGILWWAYEFGRDDMISVLIEAGIDTKTTDRHGNKPISMQETRRRLMENEI